MKNPGGGLRLHCWRKDSLKLLTLTAALTIAAALLPAGTLEVEGRKLTITNVYVRKGPAKFEKGKETLQILVADRELPLAVRTDPDAVRELMWNQQVNAMEFEIDGDTLHYSLRTEKGNLSGSRSPNPLKLAITPTHVKGKMALEEEGKYKLDADVDAAIERAPVEVPPTPADAAAARKSEAAKTYFALQAALMRGDKAGMMKLVDPEKAKMMDTPDFAQMLKIVQSMQPKNIQVLKATETGETAELIVTGDAGKQRGKAKMAKPNGQWLVMKESWSNAK